jgi:putative two-component system response regulator
MSRLLERLGVDVTTATGPLEALGVFEAERFDLIVTDIRMPGMDGHAFLAEIRARDPEVPVIVATGHASLDNAIRALRDGASGMLMKPFTGEEFQTEVRAALERSRIRRAALQYTYVTPILDGVALALTAAIEARDLETGEHCQQLGFMGERIAILMGLPELTRTSIRIGGFLHDIGKIAVPDHVLLKGGALDPQETRVMREHPLVGDALCAGMRSLRAVRPIVRHHHERLDGTGYPDGLRHRQVPLLAQIVGIVDVFDALTTARPYRSPVLHDQAFDELLLESAKGWRDRELVDTFVEVVSATRL